MPPDSANAPAKPQAGTRPRSKLFLNLDLKNSYARLGVSPLAPDKEISDRIGKLRAAAVKRLKAKGNASIDDPDQKEAFRLDRIEEEIGDPRKRRVYDEKHPQNILLTVQPSPIEQSWARHRRAGLVSNWVYGEMNEDAFCPTASCLKLWAPAGLDKELLGFLNEHVHGQAGSAAPSGQAEADLPSVNLFDDLTDLLK